jgi:hypothetical protein
MPNRHEANFTETHSAASQMKYVYIHFMQLYKELKIENSQINTTAISIILFKK